MHQVFSELTADLVHQADKPGGMRQAFGYADEKSTNPEQGVKRFHLSKAQIEDLKKKKEAGYEVIMSIPAARKSDSKYSNTEFFSLYDVRVSLVRFFLKGVRLATDPADSEQLLLLLSHAGNSTIVNETNVPISFSHSPINFGFKYNSTTGAIVEDGDLRKELNAELALPSPFAQWTVTIEEKNNDASLDLSGVTDAWFEFSGWARNFPKA
jgi:hypothetical protein